MARQISTTVMKPGMMLGRTLYDDRGRVLLRKGVIVKDNFIPKIRDSFATVCVLDDISEGIEIPESISDSLRVEVQQTLGEEWEHMQKTVSFDKVAFRPAFAKTLRSHMKNLLETVRTTSIIQEDLTLLASFDTATYVHSVNVAIYSLMLGLSLKLNDAMLVDLGVGAMLHDLGKVWIPAAILKKPGKLTTEEYNLVKRHTEIGHKVLARQADLSFLIAHCAFQHHEREDGSGYPRGLTSDQIHIFGKILAVADVYDSMVMPRPYRGSIPPGDAMEYLYSKAGREFDLEIVSIFSKKVSMYPIGTEVLLSTGMIAIVAKLNEKLPSRPTVRIMRNAQGQEVEAQDVDLAQILNVTIKKSNGASLMTMID